MDAERAREAMQPQSQFVELEGLRLHCLRWPTEKARRRALLLHALGWNARAWWKVAPRLAREGLECIAPDLRGHGLSDRPPNGYDYRTMAGDVRQLARALGLKEPLLVGHSWGATLALELASGAVAGLAPAGVVLLDGAIGQLNTLPGANEDLFVQAMERQDRADMDRQALLRHLTAPQRPFPLAAQDAHIVLANFEVDDQGRLRPRLSRERYRAVLRSVWRHPTYERFPDVRCPVLMMPIRPPLPHDLQASAHLWLNEQGVKEAQARIPRLEVRWLDDTLHDWMLLQRSAEIARSILDFAQRLTAADA